VLLPAGLDVRFQGPATLPDLELAPDMGHNLCLIYKEALHNVAKHAQATTLIVALAPTLASLTLTITDAGRSHDGPATA
jgi:signal transduction histidine kinase